MSDRQSASRQRRPRRILGLDGHQRKAQRRTLLLDAALELFGTRGYARTSIEALCQTAGIGTNSFYELFASKEAVLIGLYDRITDNFRQVMAEEIAAHQGDPGMIKAFVSAFVHQAVDDPRVARVAFMEAAGVSAEVETHRRRSRNDFVAAVQGIGEQIRDAEVGTTASDEVDVPGPSARRSAVAVVGAIIETILDWLLDPEADPIEDLIEDITYHCQRVMDAIIRESSAALP